MNITDHIENLRKNTGKKRMIIACDGAENPCKAATQALSFIIRNLKAKQIHKIDMQDSINMHQHKPVMYKKLIDGVKVDDFKPVDQILEKRFVRWPESLFFKAELESGEKIYLAHLIEPLINWASFIDKVGAVLKKLEIDEILTLGAVMSDAPHTRNMRILYSTLNGFSTSGYNFDPEDASITSLLCFAAAQNGITTKSIWGTIPHYLDKIAAPKTVYSLLSTVEEIYGLQFNLTQLINGIDNYENEANQFASINEKLGAYIKKLEEVYDNDKVHDIYIDLNSKENAKPFKTRKTDGTNFDATYDDDGSFFSQLDEYMKDK